MKNIPVVVKFRPTLNLVLVQPDAPVTQSAGGIALPDAAQEPVVEGVVLAAGPGIHDPRGVFVPISVRPGDRVTYSKIKHREMVQNGVRVLLMREPEIMLVHG